MSQPYVGEVRMFPYNFAPLGWLDCDGSLQSIAEYDVLYNLIGTTYGGDGVNTFALPDLSGRIPVQQGTGTGLGTYALGQKAGTETVTLAAAQLPAHSHAFNAVDSAASAATPANTLQLGSVSGDTIYTASTTGIASGTLAPAAVGSAGGNQPHDNTMPTLTVRYCISVFGIYPSQG
jgi:microcystin-dependent protein